jgi:TetR/AcrR family transcriptional regulator, regulator of autoinduction and epiphytic fitness
MSAQAATDTESPVDGRVRRRTANRSALVEALVALYEAGELQPTAAQIAEQAGVAVRSVYGHFGDLESLAAEVVQRQWQVHGARADVSPISGDLRKRVTELVSRRADLYEGITPVRRAGLLYVHRSETVAANLRELAKRLRAQVGETFAPELGRCGSDVSAVLDAADALLAWESWERLRTLQACSVARARRVLETALIRLLDPTRE